MSRSAKQDFHVAGNAIQTTGMETAGGGLYFIVVIFAEASVYDVMHLGLSALAALFIGYICQNMHVYKELMIHIKLMTL